MERTSRRRPIQNILFSRFRRGAIRKVCAPRLFSARANEKAETNAFAPAFLLVSCEGASPGGRRSPKPNGSLRHQGHRSGRDARSARAASRLVTRARYSATSS
ncbi:hypothetical protein JCM14124_00500 [Humidesulfovibrio idahonensis]